jgi:hypothetical protein
MKQDTKQLWINALRSDQYPQGTNVLAYKRPDGVTYYCCMGVFCEVLPYVERTYPSRVDFSNIAYVATGEEVVTVLPSAVINIEELESVNPTITYPGRDEYGPTNEHISLAELNDSGFTFNQIADMIERFL